MKKLQKLSSEAQLNDKYFLMLVAFFRVWFRGKFMYGQINYFVIVTEHRNKPTKSPRINQFD